MQLAPFKWPRRLATAGAVITLLATCGIQLRGNRDQDEAASPQASTKSDALDTRLTRCLAVTPEQAEAFEACRRIWAENRRRFFRKDRSRVTTPDQPESDQPSGSESPEEAR